MKKKLLMLVCSMTMLTYSYAATVTWDGGAGTTTWSDALNWDTDAVPTSSDDVDLDGNTVVLTASTTVLRVYAGGSSNLTINMGVTLTINNNALAADGNGALEVQGSATVTNNGTILIANTAGTNRGHGYYNKGTSVNNGTITIDGVNTHGLYVVAGTFTNATTGNITVTDVAITDSDGDNIYVDDANSGTLFGNLINNGSIQITMTTGDDGIYVNDNTTLNNESGGTITIAGATGDNGIRVDDGAAFNNKSGATLTINATPDDQLFLDNDGAFNNTGTVNLNNAVDIGLYVTDDGVFTNNTGGMVNITSSTNYAIQIDANTSGSANISNTGTITITGQDAANSADGVRIQENGTFTNNSGGNLNITDADDEGIQIDDGATPVSTFNNSGTVTISSSADHGMELFGTFNNLSGGVFISNDNTDDGIRLRNTCVFNNDGAVNINGNGSEDIETDAVDGTTFANTTNSSINPGASPGLMKIKDNFDLGAATYNIEINGTGTAGTDFDQIKASSSSNTFTIGASTKLNLIWGFTPTVGDQFKVIDASGTLTGSINIANVTSTHTVTATVSGNDLIIEVTAVVPVELTYFTGEKTNKGVNLSWETASEEINEGFDVERSSDGEQWTAIGYVQGNGNSVEAIQYNFLDEMPLNGTNYYRLKQNDFDGNFEHSDVISIEFKNANNDLKVYPNPVNDVLFIDNQSSENLEVQLYDAAGRLLWFEKGIIQQISFEDYTSGVYYIKVISSSNQIIQKIINN